MSIIIRLQKLPWTANAEDIRRFFDNLVIPDGGVHIIGGEHGDAFIVFGSDEDARQAMLKDGGMIKNAPIKLLLSSRTEMQKIIDAAKQQALNSQNLLQTLAVASQYDPSALQMPMLPHMLSMLPALRMPTVPGMPSMSVMPTLPLSVPNMMAQNATENKVVPTLATASAPSTTLKQKSDPKATEQSNQNANDKKSRSRSRSRDRRNHRDKYKRDRSRDRKYRRDRSRSKSRDRYRKRSTSKERKSRDTNRDRDRDYTRSKDRRRESESKDEPNQAARKTAQEDSARKVSSNEKLTSAAPTQLPSRDLPSNDSGKEIKNGTIMPTPMVDPTMQNWWGGVVRPPMMPWMPQQAPRLASDKSSAIPPAPPAPNLSFGMFPFNQAFPGVGVSANMFPFGRGYPPTTNTALPTTMPSNPSYSTVPNASSAESTNGPLAKAEKQETRLYDTQTQGKHEENGYYKRRKAQFPEPLEEDDENYYESGKDDEYGMKGPYSSRYNSTSYDNRKYGYSRKNYEDENSRESYGSQDDTYPRKNPYKRTYNRADYNQHSTYNYSDSHSTQPYTVSSGSTCVEIRNVPWMTNEQDIKKFFSPIPTFDSCIKFKNDKGSRNRTVLVKFVNEKQKEQALLKDGYCISGYRVHLLEIPSATWEEAEKCLPAQTEVEEPYMRISFIPKRATRDDISAIFSKPPENLIVSKDTNRESLVAHAKCSSVEEVKVLLQNKQNVLVCESRVKVEAIKESDFQIGQRDVIDPYIEKEEDTPCYSIEYPPKRPQTAPAARFQARSQNTEHSESITKSTCCLLKNLPCQVTDQEIVDFFSDINILPAQIHIMFNADYNQTGQSYCEFRNESDAEMALQKNNARLRDRTVSVDMVAKEEVTKATGVSALSPARTYDNDAVECEEQPAPVESNENGTPNDGKTESQTEEAESNGKLPSLLEIEPPKAYVEPYPVYRARAPVYRPRPPAPVLLRKSVASFGAPGCVVTIENVPYRADISEILEFFAEFDIREENVLRRFNDWGQPTGDVRVSFRSPYDAQNAVRSLNGCTIRNRTVTMSVL